MKHEKARWDRGSVHGPADPREADTAGGAEWRGASPEMMRMRFVLDMQRLLQELEYQRAVLEMMELFRRRAGSVTPEFVLTMPTGNGAADGTAGGGAKDPGSGATPGRGEERRPAEHAPHGNEAAGSGSAAAPEQDPRERLLEAVNRGLEVAERRGLVTPEDAGRFRRRRSDVSGSGPLDDHFSSALGILVGAKRRMKEKGFVREGELRIDRDAFRDFRVLEQAVEAAVEGTPDTGYMSTIRLPPLPPPISRAA